MENKEIEIDQFEGGEAEDDELDEPAPADEQEEVKAGVPGSDADNKAGVASKVPDSADAADGQQADEETKEVVESDDDCDADVPDEDTNVMPSSASPPAAKKKVYEPAPGEVSVEMLDYDAANEMESDHASVYLDAVDIAKVLIEYNQRDDWILKSDKKG